jgi:hypothetical protein
MKHHICISDEYLLFDGEMIPIGKTLIEEQLTSAIGELLDLIVPKIGQDDVIVCGDGDARRMFGRKLEDRLKREVIYE